MRKSLATLREIACLLIWIAVLIPMGMVAVLYLLWGDLMDVVRGERHYREHPHV